MCQTREANPFWRQRALAAEFQIRRLIRFAMERKRKMAADHVYLQAPYGGEIREVEAEPEVPGTALSEGLASSTRSSRPRARGPNRNNQGCGIKRLIPHSE